MEIKPEKVVMSWDTWETHIEVMSAACKDTAMDFQNRGVASGFILGVILVCLIFLGLRIWRCYKGKENAD